MVAWLYGKASASTLGHVIPNLFDSDGVSPAAALRCCVTRQSDTTGYLSSSRLASQVPRDGQPPSESNRFGIIFVGVGIVGSLAMSISFPLLTYSSTLAAFGLAHVASELRFIDQRFGERIGQRFFITLIMLLGGIVGARSALVFDLAPASLIYNVELGFVFLLALSAIIPTSGSRSSSITVASLLGIGFLGSPILTILILAVLHNLTPMGFMVEIVPPSQKKAAFIACSMIFLVLPLVIASGIPGTLFEPMLGIQKDLSILPTGPLDRHLGVFLPHSLHQNAWSISAFSAITFAQCMHYLAVIYIMPKLIKKFMPQQAIKPFFPWPKPVLFWTGILALTGVLMVFFRENFFWARTVYGIAAAVHAYLEIPILLFAFSLTKNTATTQCQPASM